MGFISFGGGGGINVPTVFVAASDATDAERSAADYLCTGAGDQLKIQEAIDELAATALAAGRVVLSSGTFTLNGSVKLRPAISIVGMGPGATTIVATTGDDMLAATVTTGTSASDVTIADLSLDGGGVTNAGVNITSGSRITIRSVQVTSHSKYGINVQSGDQVWLRDCYVGAGGSDAAFRLYSTRTVAVACQADGGFYGFDINGADSRLVGCLAKALTLLRAARCQAVGHRQEGGNLDAQGLRSTLTGAVVVGGRLLVTGDDSVASGCFVEQTNFDTAFTLGGARTIAQGNVVEGGGWYGILASGTDSIVAGNVVRGASEGLRITGTGVKHYGNDLTGNTTPLNDGGTSSDATATNKV